MSKGCSCSHNSEGKVADNHKCSHKTEDKAKKTATNNQWGK